MNTNEAPERLTLREGDATTAAVFSVTPQILRALFLPRDCTINGQYEVRWPGSGRWHSITTLPDLVPWQQLLHRAIQCLVDGDADGAWTYALRIRAFDPEQHQELTASANFILGHLEQLRGSPGAMGLYQQALSGPAVVRAAAYSNMSVDAVVRSGDVVSAEHGLTQAILSDPSFLPACVNQARLRAQLALEQAPPIPGERSWGELAQESAQHLKEVAMADAGQFLNTSFPGCAFVHLLPASFSPPPLGLRLPPLDIGADAARETLAGAVAAGREARYDTAALLADVAVEESSSVAATAAPVRRAALEQGQREQRRTLARRRGTLVADFDRELAALRWERVEEILTLLAAILSDEKWKQLVARRDRALVEYYRNNAVESADPRQAANFYSLAAQWLEGVDKAGCEEQATLLRLREARQRFRLECEEGKRIRAGKTALRLRREGAFPRLLEATLRWLKSMIPVSAQEETSVHRAESLYAQVEEQLRQGRLDAAKRQLEALRIEAPADPLVTELERRLIAAEHLTEAREHARDERKQEMMASLKLSLEFDPRNTEALGLLADAELQQRFGKTRKYIESKLVVQRALQELKCGRYEDFARSLKEVHEVSDAHFHVVLKQIEPDHGTNISSRVT